MKEQRLLAYISGIALIVSIIMRIINFNIICNEICISFITAFSILLMQMIISYCYKKRGILEEMISLLDKWYVNVSRLGYYDVNSNNPLLNKELYMKHYNELCIDGNMEMFEDKWASLGFFNYKIKKEIFDRIIIPNRNLKSEIKIVNDYTFKMYFKCKENNITIMDGVSFSNHWDQLSSMKLVDLQNKLFKTIKNISGDDKALKCRYNKLVAYKGEETWDAVCNITAKKIENQLNYLSRIAYGKGYKYFK